MMSWRNLDRVDGIAIDNNHTTVHHQLISLNRKDHVLSYTVFYEPLGDCKSRSVSPVPDNFIEQMSVETPVDREGKNQITTAFAQFANAIRPHGNSRGFEMKEAAKALTFDICFNQKFEMFGMTYRPTLGRMTQKVSYSEAAKHMPKDKNLRLLHDIAKASYGHKSKKDHVLTFEEVVFRIGRYVSQQKLYSDLFDNLDCIFRNDDNSLIQDFEKMKKIKDIPLNEWAERVNRYQSIAFYNNNPESYRKPLTNAVVPTTASRDIVDHFNIQQTAEFALNNRSIFSQEVSGAVVNYQKHVMALKHLGLM